jgi:hypothetical protein
MKLPASFFFLRAGWWAVHLVGAPALLAAAFFVGVHHAGGHGHGHAELPAAPSGPASNPVQVEMRLLEGALATAPSRFAEGDLRPLEHALHSVHAAREKTDEALEKGAYRLPENADKLARFRQLDEEFHGELEKLAEHSAKNELAPAAGALGRVVGACNGCHTEFRPPR